MIAGTLGPQEEKFYIIYVIGKIMRAPDLQGPGSPERKNFIYYPWTCISASLLRIYTNIVTSAKAI